MNIGEANAANVLMRVALGQDVDRETVRVAGELLARNAHKALMAGFTPESWNAAYSTDPDPLGTFAAREAHRSMLDPDSGRIDNWSEGVTDHG